MRGASGMMQHAYSNIFASYTPAATYGATSAQNSQSCRRLPLPRLLADSPSLTFSTMQKSICKVLLLLTIACYVAEASQRRGRALLTEVTYKKTEEHKGSTPASFKSETKSEGEWTVTTKSEHTNKGPATFSYKKTHPEEKSVSTHVSEYKGSEEATKSHKGGVFTYNSGKRHFEYTEVSKTVHNFPSTVIVYDGGKPATYTHTKEVVGPAYKKEVSYSSGAGPSYSSTWTLDARKHEKEEEKEAPAAKEGAPEPKRHRRSI